ncbi:MAG TPA: zinc ribbon domain-containing protein [Pyrinomonadaceae bacterium]|nr:zinc ribbon domain-containing protein [Pyrinomonadaceae bacterium]
MFCPRCAAENGSEQAYCRQCGLALADVQLAVQGVAAESLKKLRSGSHLMNGGIATLAVFMLIAVVITFIGVTQGHPVLTAIAMLNAAFGALIGLPLIMVGKSRMSQALHLLSGGESVRILGSQRKNQSLPAGVESERRPLPAPGSVTEHTTLDLRTQRKP